MWQRWRRRRRIGEHAGHAEHEITPLRVGRRLPAGNICEVGVHWPADWLAIKCPRRIEGRVRRQARVIAELRHDAEREVRSPAIEDGEGPIALLRRQIIWIRRVAVVIGDARARAVHTAWHRCFCRPPPAARARCSRRRRVREAASGPRPVRGRRASGSASLAARAGRGQILRPAAGCRIRNAMALA